MRTDHAELLLLVAREEEDLEVVSALLQDAIIAGADMQYDAQDNCFIIVADRFCWERPALTDMSASSGGEVHERALCGVRINHVTAVQKRCWPADWRDAFLNLRPKAGGYATTRQWLTMESAGTSTLDNKTD